MPVDKDYTADLVDRLADAAEQHLHRDLDGRRLAAQKVISDVIKVFSAAQVHEPTRYAVRLESDTSVVIGERVRVSVTIDGTFVVSPVKGRKASSAAVALRYDARSRQWRHAKRPSGASPVGAILDVAIPLLLDLRPEREPFRDPRVPRFAAEPSSPRSAGLVLPSKIGTRRGDK